MSTYPRIFKMATKWSKLFYSANLATWKHFFVTNFFLSILQRYTSPYSYYHSAASVSGIYIGINMLILLRFTGKTSVVHRVPINASGSRHCRRWPQKDRSGSPGMQPRWKQSRDSPKVLSMRVQDQSHPRSSVVSWGNRRFPTFRTEGKK